MNIRCFDPSTGEYKTLQVDSIGAGGGGEPHNPTLGAQRINLSIRDVQRTIQEGRAQGFKPFQLLGPSGLGYDQGFR